MVLCKKLYILLLFLEINILCFQNQTNFSYINNQDISIKNAFYIIRNRDGRFNLDYKYSISFLNNSKELKKNFEIKKEDNINDSEDNYYYIHEKEVDYFLAWDNAQLNFRKDSYFLDKELLLWKIIPKINEENQLVYYVQNKKNKLFWQLTILSNSRTIFTLSQTTETSNLNQSNEFQFIELYREVEKKNSTLLDQEPIDVLIKYIDLSDKKLNRKGITQIKKDEDNQELKYSVRSVLQNIPWIRKIFILMPNEEVSYFKPKNKIEEKIVYVKDKDILGFDSASIYAFLYHLYKMKQFGMSENFILMDDDYFIAGPLQKNDFFYEENGTILPALVADDYYEMNLEKLQKKLALNLAKKASSNAHSDIGFYIQQTRALIFLYKLFGNDDIRFGKKLIEPAFTHNAFSVKMSDIKEIHDYILYNYEYANITLFSLVRTNLDLNMHTMYMTYVRNKYGRKTNKISHEFYDLSAVKLVKSNKKKLFVINTSIRNYNSMLFEREKLILEELFPHKTKYELDFEETENIFDKIKTNISNNVNKIKNINNNISISVNNIKNVIKMYYPLSKNDTYFEEILKEEIQIMKQYNKWQRKFISFFLFIVLLFMAYKIYNYLKIIIKRFKIEQYY